ncbi:hypothetical protein [Streptomyces sp. NPDC020141]|uniref:hypothetical protein n=1 Tax=Streptomyces sp. NPDC020141 TaxID=3365065 RepID=UPI0037B09514
MDTTELEQLRQQYEAIVKDVDGDEARAAYHFGRLEIVTKRLFRLIGRLLGRPVQRPRDVPRPPRRRAVKGRLRGVRGGVVPQYHPRRIAQSEL